MENNIGCDKNCLLGNYFRNSSENMFITSRDGHFIDVNPSMANLLGYTRDEIIKNPVHEIYDSEEDRLSYQSLIEKDGTVKDFQVTLKHKNGKHIFCLINAIVWKDKDRIVGYHGIIHTRENLQRNFQSFFNRLKEERIRVQDERKNLFSDSKQLLPYVNMETIEYIKKTGINPMEASSRKVSILFFDIRNSTGIAESLSPKNFANFLSEIFTDIMDLIYGSGGSVNKMLGDGIMATFGCPLSSGNDAMSAVRTAVLIQDYLDTYNDVRPDYIIKPILAGIGIATGIVFTGLIGSVHREEYAVLGDSVNIASRLESLTKKVDSKILVDDNTFREVHEEFPFKKCFKGKVRGRKEPLRMYSM